MTTPANNSLYASKLTTAETAASLIPSNVNISMGMALGEPPALLTAISKRLEAEELSGMKLWYLHSMPCAGETVLRYEFMDRLRPHCMFMGPIERELRKQGDKDGRKVVEFVPAAFSAASDVLCNQTEIDTFITTVSPMDRHGWFTFGCNNDYATSVARAAKRLIVEVNPNLPRTFGDGLLHISEVDAVIEHEAPLFETPVRQLSPEDVTIGKIISDMVEDGACLQMGIGALPNAVCAQLRDRKDLGIHTELLSPGLVDLIECGAVTNRKKITHPGRSVFTFALGDQRMYDLLDDNPSIIGHPVQHVNDPRHIAKNPNVVSINATLELDLTGACNSEHMQGRQYSGSGGQLDFVRGAVASKNGKSIIACHSTAKKGSLSRIVPELTGPVTTPRNDVDYVVTEYGAVQLRGLSTGDRARAIIKLAHPDYRDELTKAAKQRHLIS